MLDLADAGDWQAARAAQVRSIKMIRLCQEYGGLPAFKFLMSFAGINCGPVRLPMGNMSDDDKRVLRTKLSGSQVIAPAGAANRS